MAESEFRTMRDVGGPDQFDQVPPTVAPEPQSNVEPADTDVNYSAVATTTFPEEWKSDFEGLLYLGYLEDLVEIPFHSFLIRTLLPVSKIEIRSMLQSLETSVGYGSAYRACCVAAALDAVDDRPLVVANKRESVLRQKYEWVINTLYEPVIAVLYERLDALEARQIQVMQELGLFGDPTEQPAAE